jgi:hypothetical protein
MKQIYSVLMALLVLVSVSGLGSAAVTFSGLANVSTTDTTPTITFTVTTDDATNDSSMWGCNLWIDGEPYGTVTASNATSTSITCNQTLASGFSGDYNVSAYNTTGGTHFSTGYTLDVSTFGGLIAVISDVAGVFSPIVDLIIAVGTIMIALAMIGFVMALILGLFKAVNGVFGKTGK